MRKMLVIAMLVLAASILVSPSAFAGKGGGKGGGKPGGGSGGGGCTPAASRIAYVTAGDLVAANPDGTCAVQLTTGMDLQGVTSWSDDEHILVYHDQTDSVTLLQVPDSADASSVSVVSSFALPGRSGVLSAHRDAGGVLPATQQLIATVEDPAGPNHNIVVYSADGTTRTQLTNYSWTYVPGGTYTEYVVSSPRWMAGSADHTRARLAFDLYIVNYVDGEMVSAEGGIRVLSLDTADWPSVSPSNMTESWACVANPSTSNPPVPCLGGLSYSRDGSQAVRWADPGSGTNALYVVPVDYDDGTDSVSFDTANEHFAATSVDETYCDAVAPSFSSDNSYIAYVACTLVGKGKRKTNVGSVFAIGSSAASGSVEVDDQGGQWAGSPVWGP